jgi:hypothetical protein
MADLFGNRKGQQSMLGVGSSSPEEHVISSVPFELSKRSFKQIEIHSDLHVIRTATSLWAGQPQKGKYMTQRWKFAFLTLLIGGAASFAPFAKADEWDKQTIVTFNEPVEVPGSVLPAGTYVFKLADSQSDRSVVQIFTEDQKQLLGTIMAIPAYRVEPSDKTVVTFEERPAGSPEALHKWFYPGDTSGLEFVYPKSETELAANSGQPASPPATAAPLAPPAAQQKEPESAAPEAVREESTALEVVIAQEELVVPSESSVQDTLPRTAGNFAMFPILGIALLSGGLAACRSAKRLGK